MKSRDINPIMLQSIKETNYKSVLFTIEERVKISRTEISRITSLSPATVTNACNKLLKEGLIVEISRGYPSRGRKPIFLEINPDAGEVIGVAISKRSIRVAISNFKCEIIASSTTSIDDHSDLTNMVIDLINQIVNVNKPKNVIGIGIAIDWIYDYTLNCPQPIHNIDKNNLRNAVGEYFKYPVSIDKCSNLSAIAESNLYYTGNYNNLVYLDIDDNISAGIIINNVIPGRSYGPAGEIGHINFQYSGQKCICGRSGCIHSFCSTTSLIQKAIESVLSGQNETLSMLCNNDLNAIDIPLLEAAAASGDKFTLQLIDNYIDYLLVLLDSLIQLYMPQVIILGGKISVFKKIISKILPSKIESSGNSLLKNIIIDFSHFGSNSAVKGACRVSLLNSLSKLELEDKDE